MRKLMLLAVLCLLVPALYAQDPVKVDPKHYKVEFENPSARAAHQVRRAQQVDHAQPSR